MLPLYRLVHWKVSTGVLYSEYPLSEVPLYIHDCTCSSVNSGTPVPLNVCVRVYMRTYNCMYMYTWVTH